jgi:hypothetical protein
MTPKFKIGDKIKCSCNKGACESIGIITEVDNDMTIYHISEEDGIPFEYAQLVTPLDELL